MIKEYYESFKDNILSKSTNPFFGSLIIVWSFHNWRFLYTIFNFLKETPNEDRIAFIASYLYSGKFLPNLGWCIVFAFIVLIISYFLLNLSRLIINLYEKVLTPFVYKITDQSSIVLKEDYLKLNEEKNKLVEKLEAERGARLNVQAERDSLEIKLSQMQNAKNVNDIATTTVTPPPSKSDINKYDKESAIISKIEEEKLLNAFDNIIEKISNIDAIYDNEPGVRYFSKLGLITKGTYIDQNQYNYSFTKLGDSVKTYYLDNYL